MSTATSAAKTRIIHADWARPPISHLYAFLDEGESCTFKRLGGKVVGQESALNMPFDDHFRDRFPSDMARYPKSSPPPDTFLRCRLPTAAWGAQPYEVAAVSANRGAQAA